MKDFNIAKYLKENHLGSHGILGRYVDLHGLKEDKDLGQQEAMPEPYEGDGHPIDGLGGKLNRHMDVSMNEAENSFDVSFLYADYPSISDRERNAGVRQFINLIKTLGGKAEIINDEFDTVDFNITGISSFEELKNKYDQVVADEEDAYWRLGSWDLEPKEENMEEADMNFNDEIASLSIEYKNWLEKNNLPLMSADELLSDYSIEKTDEQKAWLQTFIDRWDDAQNADNIDEEVSVSSSGVEMEEGWSEEQDKYDRMMGLAHEYFEKVSPIVRYTIDKLRADGFDDQDILDFMATDFS